MSGGSSGTQDGDSIAAHVTQLELRQCEHRLDSERWAKNTDNAFENHEQRLQNHKLYLQNHEQRLQNQDQLLHQRLQNQDQRLQNQEQLLQHQGRRLQALEDDFQRRKQQDTQDSGHAQEMLECFEMLRKN